MRDNICLQSIVGNPRSVVVVEYPAKVLRKKALLLTESDRTYLPAVLNIMEEKMKAHNGIGLAAPQIGLSKRLVVIEFNCIDANGKNSYVKLRMLNPEIVAHSKEKIDSSEGCLSFPSVYAIVKRYKTVSVKYLDEKFKEQTISDASGLLSCCLQHECGHLDGEMFFHKLSKEKQKLVLDTYGRIKSGEIELKSVQYALVCDDEVRIMSRGDGHYDESDTEEDDDV